MTGLFKNNVACAIDIYTTGNDFKDHELIEIAIIPLTDTFDTDSVHNIFNISLLPAYPDTVDFNAMKMSKDKFEKLGFEGFGREDAVPMFEKWCEGIGIKEVDRIMPITFDYIFAQKFIEKWLGHDIYTYYFCPNPKDVMQVAEYFKTRSHYFIEPAFTNNVTLLNLCSYFKLDKPKYLLEKCIAIGQIYKRFIEEF